MILTSRLYVIVFTSHQMPSTEVNPLQLGEPWGEFLLNMPEGALKDIGTTLTMAMTMEPLYIGRQLPGQFVCCDPKAGTRSAGIIQQGTDL